MQSFAVSVHTAKTVRSHIYSCERLDEHMLFPKMQTCKRAHAKHPYLRKDYNVLDHSKTTSTESLDAEELLPEKLQHV